MNKLLLLCTGNYYRSRYAEILFNHFALQRNLNWQSESRGIAIDLGIDNKGPMSIHALEGLNRHDLYPDLDALREPMQLEENDLKAADLIIALYETEHRPLLEQRFPAWSEHVNYWQAPDIQHRKLSIEATLAYIDRQVFTLLDQLKNR
jgi:protein-tyrosine phosphatase